MKFKYKLPSTIKLISVILAILLLGSAVVYLLECLNVFGLTTNSIPSAITGAVVCLLSFVLVIAFNNISYTVSTQHLKQNFLFFDLLGKRVLTKNIVNVVYKKNIDKLYFSYIGEALDPIIVLVSIDKTKVADFVNAVKQANVNVVYFEEE